MSWLDTILRRLAEASHWSYKMDGPPAAEPTALAALALLAHERPAEARRALDWITRIQTTSGTVGVTAREKTPCWPTALAVLAWSAWDRAHGTSRYRGCIERAARWALGARGKTSPQSPLIGHDTTLAGWPWAMGTHSWLEPTAYFVLALKAAGRSDHPRSREAVRLLVDRLLPSGGCNYGNTVVMGQELLPHVQPTGVVLLALAGERVDDPRLGLSLDYIQGALTDTRAPASLAWGIMGLGAHGRRPPSAGELLETACARQSCLGPRAYTDALAALAALSDERNPLVPSDWPQSPSVNATSRRSAAGAPRAQGAK